MSEFRRLTGEFVDPATERDYRRSVLPSVRADSRLGLFVAAALMAMFAISDYNFMGLSSSFYLLLAVRTVMVIGCLVMAFVLARSDAFIDRPWLYSAAPLLIGTGVLLILYLRPHSAPTILTSTIVIIMGFYLFLPNLLAGTVASSAYLSVTFAVGAWLWAGFGLVGAISMALLLAMANIVGYFVALRLAVLQRRHFVSLGEERAAREMLALEVEHRKALEQQLRVMAQTDPLTGLANRRHVMELAAEALPMVRRRGRACSVCMIDVDHFKSVNDQWGHGGGDAVLRAIAAALRQALDQSHMIGRFGGEEFVVCLPGADLRAALQVADTLRQRIEGLRFDGELSRLRVTITVGVAEVELHEATIDAALIRADGALYEGKRAGRNCVMTGTSIAHKAG